MIWTTMHLISLRTVKLIVTSITHNKKMNFFDEHVQFHPQQHWAYGCNCMISVDDRQMSKTSLGAPVDEIDKVCKKLKVIQN